MTDPNSSYSKFEDILATSYNKHFPEKRVKVNKYKHKLSGWITSGIIKFIELRDDWYKRFKMSSEESSDHMLLKFNLKWYDGYLSGCIRAAKKYYYTREFIKYKNVIRKTWDTLKDIINKKKSKSEFPPHFSEGDTKVIGAKNIAEKFNEYFTGIGPNLANEIDVSNKSLFETYLRAPSPSVFYFQYTEPKHVEKLIHSLKPKNSAGHDNISSKLLKEIVDIISRPISIIINQSLCTGIFPDKLKLAKVIPLFKKDDDKIFGNYRPISLLSSISKVFEKVAFDQLYDYLTSHGLLFDSQYGFRRHYTGTQQRYRTNIPWRQNPRFQIYVYFWWKHCTTNEVIPQQYRVAESSPVHHQTPMCYVKKAILQNQRFTTQVHTKHNQPRYTVYNLNWNKKQAGLTKSKHSIALSKTASYHKANHWS